jgi:hypothetical protein
MHPLFSIMEMHVDRDASDFGEKRVSLAKDERGRPSFWA